MRPSFQVGVLACLCGLISDCRDPATLSGTAVMVVCEAEGLEVDQLQYEGFIDGGVVFGSQRRPPIAAGPVASSTRVRVLLPDSFDGALMLVRVVGLRGGLEQGDGRGRVQVRAGFEETVTVRLTAIDPVCPGCTGCCSAQALCVSPVAAACGLAGSRCVECDAMTSDSCGADGRCGCGASPPCLGASGADRCVAGQCRCGTSQPCEAGLECLQRLCQCTPESCSGCCQGGRCITAASSSACGAGGSACLDCGGSPCVAGRCAAVALCNATNCPAGCCVGAQCQTGREAAACGRGGQGCLSCGTGLCDGGVCQAQCGPVTCRGCCNGTQCSAGTQDTACGKDGLACLDCARRGEECKGFRCRD
jgi:hypothetical protein